MVSLLASCNTATTNDGSSVKVVENELRTEYRFNGEYVGCNDVDKKSFFGLFQTNWNQKTQVAVPFTVNGSVAEVEVELVGSTTRSNNGFTTKITGEDLKRMSVSADNTNKFKALFDADVTQGRILPTSIKVNPITIADEPRTIKEVTATGLKGSFYVNVKLKNDSGTAESNPFRLAGASKKINVYENCVITKDTGDKL